MKCSLHLQEFTATAVLAYECGYSEPLVRDEVTAIGSTTLGESFQEVTESMVTFQSSQDLKLKRSQAWEKTIADLTLMLVIEI